MDRDTTPVPSDDPEISSDAAPDEQELTISAAEEAEMRREVALELENFEGGIQG
ncbi:hypothetical protein ABC304_15540 [Microbacterium sp. 1P10UB]|uniref:hypothetical protein n=1 Tax=unclassified Microbacterium TaxID=2609290 RepID=UPI0039A007FD